MPYIDQDKRDVVNPDLIGELNFMITMLCDNYIMSHGKTYGVLNAVIGALECSKLELYRRVAAPYEDKKMSENGDVFSSVSL